MEKSKTKVQGKVKRLLSVVLAALTIGSTVVTTSSLTGVGISASAVTSTVKSSSSDFKYLTNKDKTITITGYKGSKTNVAIPSKINGKSVTEIGSGAFGDCTKLTSITIPNSVTAIYAGAFENCKGLTSITIPNSVTIIGSWAFSGCTGLKSVKIGNSVTEIYNCAFLGCTGLTSVTIPDSVTLMSYSVFEGCTGLKSITILGSIGIRAFSGCTGIKSVTIPDSVTSIGGGAFNGCTGLKSIKIPDSVTEIGGGAFDNTAWYNNHSDGLVYAGKVAYKYKGKMPKNTNITLKNGTKGITDWAFEDCTELKSITIPSSVKAIGNRAFWGCDNLTIRGVKGSAAEKYAKENSMKFVAILANTSKINKSTIYKGESITITGAATGGTKSYKYEMYVKSSSAKNWTKIKSYSTTATKTWKPDKTGKYYVRVNVNDGKTTVSKTLTLTILSPLVNKSTVSKTNVKKGSTITLKAAATGGKSPYKYTFTYRNANSKNWKTLKSNTSYSTYNMKMNKAGKYYFNIYVKDSGGKSVKKTFTVTVK